MSNGTGILDLRRNDQKGALAIAARLEKDNELDGEACQALSMLQDDPVAFSRKLNREFKVKR